jgi:hypothetical protein
LSSVTLEIQILLWRCVVLRAELRSECLSRERLAFAVDFLDHLSRWGLTVSVSVLDHLSREGLRVSVAFLDHP